MRFGLTLFEETLNSFWYLLLFTVSPLAVPVWVLGFIGSEASLAGAGFPKTFGCPGSMAPISPGQPCILVSECGFWWQGSPSCTLLRRRPRPWPPRWGYRVSPVSMQCVARGHTRWLLCSRTTAPGNLTTSRVPRETHFLLSLVPTLRPLLC